MEDDTPIRGELVSEPDASLDGLTVETWQPDVNQDQLPAGGPVDSTNQGSWPALLDTAEVDENGRFALDTPPGEEVFLRVFDGQKLLVWGRFDIVDGSLAIDIRSQDGTDWRIPGGIAGGVAALAGFWYFFMRQDNASGSDGGTGDGSTPGDGNIPGTATPGNTTPGNTTPSNQDGSSDDGTSDPISPGDDDSSGGASDLDPDVDAPDESGTSVRRPTEQSSFLYTGDDSIQKDVDDGAIEASSAAVLRGRVTDRNGEPLAGVRVSIQGYPEFGRTETRENGLYDLAVTGGRQYTINHSHDEYLPVQRRQEIPANDYHFVGEVALTAVDDEETTVEMDANQPQVHAATPVEDDAGRRQTRLYFPPGTTASTGNDGGGQATELSVRATEYTVGQNGQSAMPGELPTGTGYTYAAELTAETESDGGDDSLTRPLMSDTRGDVEFSDPVVLYQDNFLDFPVGRAVPTGVLGREDATWDAVGDGRVIEVLGVSDGMATLDITGSGSATSRNELLLLGVTDDEREMLADAYEAGTTLWRVPVDHFTPYDCNWPIEPDNNVRAGTRGDCE